MQVKPFNTSFLKIFKPRLISKAYTSCNDLPLYNFIELTVTNDLNWLVIEGKPDNLEVIWGEILAEYGSLSGDDKMSRMYKLRKTIAFLTNKINNIKSIVNYLSLRRVEEGIILLQTDLGFRFDFTDLQTDLKRVLSITKSDEFKLNTYIGQYNVLRKSGGKENTRADWDDNIRELSKYMGGSLINKKTTSVSEYLAIERGFKVYVEILKKNQGRA